MKQQWEIDFNWLKVQHFVKDNFRTNDLPKLDTVLFIIGLQELGLNKQKYSHEQKLDITAIGMMTILSSLDYFRKTGTDEDGWPVWTELKPYRPENDTVRQNELKALIAEYFEKKYDIRDYEQKL
ncbi:MAG: hypothetical protein ACM3PT_12280 [Deltaproteobacteria bacterium]